MHHAPGLFERVVFWIAILLILGPFIALYAPGETFRDKFGTVWAKTFLLLIKVGAVAGAIMFVFLLLDRLSKL